MKPSILENFHIHVNQIDKFIIELGSSNDKEDKLLWRENDEMRDGTRNPAVYKLWHDEERKRWIDFVGTTEICNGTHLYKQKI